MELIPYRVMEHYLWTIETIGIAINDRFWREDAEYLSVRYRPNPDIFSYNGEEVVLTPYDDEWYE